MRGTPLILLCALSLSVSSFAVAQTDRATEAIAAARMALGGESRIAAIKTFIANGRTRQIRGDNLVPIEFEIQIELPDRYSRRDEFPAQDAGPVTSGVNGDRLIQIPALPAPGPRGGASAPPGQQDTALRTRAVTAQQDFARLMLGLFAGSFPAFPVTFAYVGQAEAPQGTADVLDVRGPADFAARLFIDGQTHLPLMLTWQAVSPPRRGGPPPPSGAPVTGPAGPPAGVEQRLYFADHRRVDGLQLPFRIRLARGADTVEETTFDRFRINARIDPGRFDVGN